MITSSLPLSLADIEAARERIGDRLYRTPFSKAWNLSKMTGTRLRMKLENLQVTGSFKERGALNRLLMMSEQERGRGVITASAGNHAQGLALHAARLDIHSTIVMPESTPLVKVERTKRYGGKVILHGANFDEAQTHAREICESEGKVFIHAFDDLGIMAGQGTIGLEILEQDPMIQTLVIPIGGGGLISGIATAIKEINPRIRIIGVEAAHITSMAASLASGEVVAVEGPPTIAEGIAVQRVSETAREIVANLVDEVVCVSEEEIASAILALIEEEKVVAEGAGAAPLAAVLHRRFSNIDNSRIGVMVCGGNIDSNLIAQILERGLVKAGRRVQLHVTISDQPGALAELTNLIGKARANILQIHHDRTFHSTLGQTEVELSLETRGHEHVEAISAQLINAGFIVQQS